MADLSLARFRIWPALTIRGVLKTPVVSMGEATGALVRVSQPLPAGQLSNLDLPATHVLLVVSYLLHLLLTLSAIYSVPLLP